MNGFIVSDLPGRMRVRVANGLVGQYDFEVLRDRLSRMDQSLTCVFNELTGGLLINYRAGERRREALLAFLAKFEPDGPAFEEFLTVPDEEDRLPANPIWGHLAKKAVLPLPVRAVLHVFKAIPHLFEGIASLFRGRLNVEVLDASALAVCFLRRDFRSAGTLLFFFSLGHFLEAWAKKRSRAGLYKSLAGQTGKVWVRHEDGTEVLVDENELTVGSLVIIRAGSPVPVDGVVVEGEAMVNQVSMTGEPLAVRRVPGGTVFAGTSVEEGAVIVRANRVGSETRLRSIVSYIEESEASKAGIQGRAERLADSIVPFSFILAAAVFLITRDPLKAGNVLLVDYSCAIRLSTPLAVLAAMREGNERGIMIKGGRFLEELSLADTVIFDKTGTLTSARPEVAEVIAFEPFSRREALRLAACLEEHFPHPVGRAVVRQANVENLHHEEEHAKVDYVVAHGISSTWQGKKVVLGSRHFVVEDEKIVLTEDQMAAAEAEASLGRSVLYLAVGGHLAALLSIKDEIRPGVRGLLNDLRAAGLNKAVMLTGDVERTAATLAAEVGFTEYKSQLLPDQKADYVKGMVDSGRRVMMVGDGLNDSAALSRSNVGVAMSDGSALAKDVANVVLLNGRVENLLVARRLADETMKRVRGNYRIIVSFNTVFLALGLTGLAGPAVTALMHNMTTAWVAWRANGQYLKNSAGALPPVAEEQK